MKRLDYLVKKILLGSTALYTTSYSQSPFVASVSKESDNDNTQINSVKKDHYRSKPKLILKQMNDDDVYSLISHRSHRSHSSHRSHYSHYSSRTSTPSTPTPTRTETVTSHELGSRALKIGMEGEDVLELVKLLKNEGYNLILNKKFDGILLTVVMDFQSKVGETTDGIVGPLTIYYLKNKDARPKVDPKKEDNNKYEFGERALYKGMKGADVLELEKELKNEGYKIEPDEIYDETSEAMIKDYQSKNAIPVDGIVGYMTYHSLKY